MAQAASHDAENLKAPKLGKAITKSPDNVSSSSPPELKFVVMTGPHSQRSKESRLIVRSHAMMSFLREKKIDVKAPVKKDPEMQVKGLREAIGRFKLSSWSRKRSVKALSLAKEKTARSQSEIDASTNSLSRRTRTRGLIASPELLFGHLDPFGIIPIALTARIQKLLLHYTTAFSMNSVAVNPEGTWLSFALTDAALLHATLAIVAHHYDITHGRHGSLECLYEKGEAIKKVNCNLGDATLQLGDTTIASVALFAIFETMNGTRSASDVHMMALERMVSVRKGIQRFDHNKLLQRVLTWADIMSASTWNCPPRFQLLEPCRKLNHICSLERFSSVNYPSLPDYGSLGLYQLSPNLYSSLETLRRISNAAASFDQSMDDRAAVSDKIYILEHTLLSSQDIAEMNELHYYGEANLAEAFRIAAVLYMNVILRELPHTAKMHVKLVSKLKSVLEEQSVALVSTASRQTLELLAWMLFMGGAAAADLGERRHFVALLVCVSNALGLEGRDELKATLRCVLWLERVCEGYFSTVWDEIVLL